MSHMVIYRGADGRPGYHQTEQLDDAVRFVEGLRNEEGVEHARIFRMDEVSFEFRPYFRVEIGDEAGAPEAPAPEVTAPAPTPTPRPAKTPEPVAAVVAETTPAAEAAPATEAAPAAAMADAVAGDSWTAPSEPAGNGASVGRRGLFGR